MQFLISDGKNVVGECPSKTFIIGPISNHVNDLLIVRSEKGRGATMAIDSKSMLRLFDRCMNGVVC